MAEVLMNSAFKLKRGTAAQWKNLNIVLQLGEPGFEKDTYKLKIGDGARAWNDLPYIGTVAPSPGGGGGTDDYVMLINKPSINGTELVGNMTIKEDATYVHNQLAASKEWVITHNLGKYPSISIVDSGNNIVVGEVVYNSTNQLTVKFSSIFSGKAYLN